jgi:hypothetical protein
MFRPLLLGAVIVVGIAAAPHASADTNGYLQMLSDGGITATNPGDQQKLVQVGNIICRDIHSGTSPSDEASKMAAKFQVSDTLAVTVVGAAQKQLC